ALPRPPGSSRWRRRRGGAGRAEGGLADAAGGVPAGAVKNKGAMGNPGGRGAPIVQPPNGTAHVPTQEEVLGKGRGPRAPPPPAVVVPLPGRCAGPTALRDHDTRAEARAGAGPAGRLAWRPRVGAGVGASPFASSALHWVRRRISWQTCANSLANS